MMIQHQIEEPAEPQGPDPDATLYPAEDDVGTPARRPEWWPLAWTMAVAMMLLCEALLFG